MKGVHLWVNFPLSHHHVNSAGPLTKRRTLKRLFNEWGLGTADRAHLAKWHGTRTLSSLTAIVLDTMWECVRQVISVVSDSLATPWTVTPQVPLSMGFSRQEHRSVLPYPPPGDLPNPGTGAASPESPALAGRFFTTSATWEASDSKAKGSLKVTKWANGSSASGTVASELFHGRKGMVTCLEMERRLVRWEEELLRTRGFRKLESRMRGL